MMASIMSRDSGYGISVLHQGVTLKATTAASNTFLTRYPGVLRSFVIDRDTYTERDRQTHT